MSSSRMNRIEAQAASILTQSSIELRQLGIDLSMPPVPIVEICNLRGLSVNPQVHLHYEDMKLAGMLDALQKAVYYEAKDILGRQHFSIAHELGHYEIHWPAIVNKYGTHDIEGQFVDFEDTFTRYFKKDETLSRQSALLFRIDREGKKRIVYNPEIETEANYFAQFIMLPKHLVMDAAQAVMGLPYLTAKHVLAHQFEVSDAAMDLRLKQLDLVSKFEYSHERKFFADLGREKTGDQAKLHREPVHTIIVAPESRLRALVAEIDGLDQPIGQILLDFCTFDGAGLNLFGVTLVVELALLHDYIVDKYNIRAEEPISCILPDPAGHIIRHIGRLGLSSHLGISSGQYLVQPQATITGNHILLKLTRIDEHTDVEAIALHIKNHIIQWVQSASDEFAEINAKVILQIARDIVLYSSDSLGCGAGYLAVELQNMYSNGELVGYRLISTVGDIGISIIHRLSTHFEADFTSSYDAIEAYCSDHTERASLFREVVLRGGYFQINSGDVMYHIGQGSRNFFTDLHQMPGLQITSVISFMMEQGKET